MPFLGIKYSFVLANAAAAASRRRDLPLSLYLEPSMVLSLAVGIQLPSSKLKDTRLNMAISLFRALEGVWLLRWSVFSSSSVPTLDKITSGFWSLSERLIVSLKMEMCFPQAGLHVTISSELMCKNEHTYQIQVGFAPVNKTRPEHEGSTQLPCFTTLLSNTIAIIILDLGWITAGQASLLIR